MRKIFVSSEMWIYSNILKNVGINLDVRLRVV